LLKNFNYSYTNSKTGFYGSGSSFCLDNTTPPISSEESQPIFNLITTRLSDIPTTAFTNYFSSDGIKKYEEVVIEKDVNSSTVTVNTLPSFIKGDVTIYKGIKSDVVWVPNHAGDPSLLKHFTNGTVLFDTLNFTNGIIKYSSDASKSFEGNKISAEGVGLFGNIPFGKDGFGGSASSAPFRLLVPRNKARCRYLSSQFINENAREEVRVFGVSYTVAGISPRAYRRTDG
jgi:hypothetical protein